MAKNRVNDSDLWWFGGFCDVRISSLKIPDCETSWRSLFEKDLPPQYWFIAV